MDDNSLKQNQVQQPPNYVGTPRKEGEVPVSDYIIPSEAEPRIDKEVIEAGVEKVNQAPELTNEHFKIGVQHSAETTPVQREPKGFVKLPIDQGEANVLAKGNISDSKTWWASLIKMIFKKIRLSSAST